MRRNLSSKGMTYSSKSESPIVVVRLAKGRCKNLPVEMHLTLDLREHSSSLLLFLLSSQAPRRAQRAQKARRAQRPRKQRARRVSPCFVVLASRERCPEGARRMLGFSTYTIIFLLFTFFAGSKGGSSKGSKGGSSKGSKGGSSKGS